MLPALTPDGCLEILRGRVDRAWLEEVLAEPDGQAMVMALCDVFAAVDGKDAKDAASLFVAPHSLQIDEPASGAQKAITTLAFTLKKQVKIATPIPLPAGTRVSTPDGHVFVTDEALSWGQGEVGVTKTVGGTALFGGHPGVIPPEEITQFVDVARGLSGVGTAIQLVTTSGVNKALRLVTNTGIPHPFKDVVIGMLAQIVSADFAGNANIGRCLQLAQVNGSATDPTAAATPEGASGWGAIVNTASDSRYSGWTLGTFGFEWRVVPWAELFTVSNMTAVEGGRDATLDEAAQSRARPRQPDEADEQLRARLLAPPDPPSPLGVLRKCIRALVPFGVQRADILVYEMGEAAPASDDPYKDNFPASIGMVSDLHCSDMTTPETPDGMASQDPSYATLSPFFNPGLALLDGGPQRWTVIVRWDPPGGLSSDTIVQVRRLLYAAAKRASQPGCIVELYELAQWSYPP